MFQTKNERKKKEKHITECDFGFLGAGLSDPKSAPVISDVIRTQTQSTRIFTR
jgi:hypothetical protein